MKKILLILLFSFCKLVSFASDEKFSRVKILLNEKSINELSRLGIDAAEGEYRENLWFISDFSESEIQRIHDGGFSTEILIDDVKLFYRSRNNVTEEISKTPRANCGFHKPYYTVPQHFYLGSMGGYFTYVQLMNILDSMRLQYPGLITIKEQIDTTLSIENRPIYFVKISDNPDIDETEPEVLYSALHHAREPESLSQLIFYMWYLLENYTSDTTVKALVDNTEMYFIPCLNPDGYIYNENTDPFGGGMWRKNRRDNLDATFGVDLNRNYGFLWGYDTIGSSINTNDATYRGASPFSEPETRAIRNFMISRDFKFCLNYHTFGNHLIRPWGFIPDSLTPDSIPYDLFSRELTKYNNYNAGTTNQTLNYLVNGDADAWMYGEQAAKPKVFAMTPEVGESFDGFWPAQDRIIPLCEENMYANLTLAKLAGRYGILSHLEDRYTSQLNNQFHFSFRQLGLDTTGSYTISISPISSNIVSVGNPIAVTNLSLIQLLDDSISFTLSSSINDADEIRFVVLTNNGWYVESDTITMLFGNPFTVFSDDSLTTNNWDLISGPFWGITQEDFVSPPYSITDSPYNDYLPFSDEEISLINAVSLTGAIDARLVFFTKWNIESTFDYVQVLASNDNGLNWIPLCGNYTVPGSASQVIGEPVYDNNRFNWVNEEMSLNDFLGQSILIQFKIVTDQVLEFDGFYFDDLKIKIIQNSIQAGQIEKKCFISDPFPNPSSENTSIYYQGVKYGSVIYVYNSLGKIVWQMSIDNTSGKIQIPIKSFSAGIYSYFIMQPDGSISSARMILKN